MTVRPSTEPAPDLIGGSGRTATVAVVCFLAVVAGCGYSTTRLLPSNYRAIYIEPFRNGIQFTKEPDERTGLTTTLPALEETVTRELISQFLIDGNLRVTTKREEADLILDGKLLDFFRQALKRLPDNTVEEYRLNLVASLNLRDRSGKLIFSEPSFIGDTTYLAAGSSAVSESSAVTKLMTDFSKRVVERIIEDW
ncbi:MAG: hypothetical protein HY211_07880 [Candidatus Omnitrophica bacterium]|nr:hypothetical protein [Candidatus Omnitrophota bacterium]